LGTAEKGNLSLRLTVSIPGGHSSMPAAETSIDVLSAALMRIRAKPFEPKFSQPVKDLLRAVGPEMPFFKKMIFANAWLFKSIIISQYEKSGPGNAMVRTTAVPTIYNSGIKDNIIPTVASAILNIRLLPGDSSRDIIDQVNRTIADERVKVEVYRVALTEGSGVTSVSSDGFKTVAGAVRKSISGAVVSPFLMIGATDSRHFSALSDGIIRFSPMIDPIAFHGIDERVSLESYQTGLWFYEQLIRSF
jgi:carboxypeptidase PM20D1